MCTTNPSTVNGVSIKLEQSTCVFSLSSFTYNIIFREVEMEKENVLG